MKLNIIAAHDEKYGIGKENKLPWYYKEDLLFFSRTTKYKNNNAIVMGSNTWKSLGSKPLKNRVNYVLSRKTEVGNSNGANFYRSVKNLMTHLEMSKYDEVWIIGGQSIYEYIITNYSEKIHKCVLTKVIGDYDCDTFFPIDLLIEKTTIRSYEKKYVNCGEINIFYYNK